jgi:ABC-type hemin transport system ATPase subunit
MQNWVDGGGRKTGPWLVPTVCVLTEDYLYPIAAESRTRSRAIMPQSRRNSESFQTIDTAAIGRPAEKPARKHKRSATGAHTATVLTSC